MVVGFIGLGKLGLPVALTIESKGYKVVGYDVNPNVAQYLKNKKIPFVEKDIEPYLENTQLELLSLPEVVKQSDIIFVAVQTPHQPEYDGANILPTTREDFDYSYLVDACKQIAEVSKDKLVAIISTVLPGTIKREIQPILDVAYTPQFIAMGTVIDDYLNPEFNLIGASYDKAKKLESFYKTINDAPMLITDPTTAECIKVSYNTFITAKTVLANTWGEIAQKVGADVDDITRAWSISNKRLLSSRYLKAGVGDGGGCHPRDNIALSWLAESIGLSFNIFESLMLSRQNHMEYIADLIEKEMSDLPIILLGKSFKPETNITSGSPALLLGQLLDRKGIDYEQIDPKVDDVEISEGDIFSEGLYVLATAHPEFSTYQFVSDSVVIDPFGLVQDQPGVKVIRIGRS